jgi:hypothetical protein
MSAQIGGSRVYPFLNFSYSARQSALGGSLISVNDDDPSLIIYNPSSISEQHHHSLLLHFTDYFTTTGYGSVLYSHTFKHAGSFAFEARCVQYGTFNGMDEWGYETGHFTAGDCALTAAWGRTLSEHFSIGASLKLLFSGYESYNSFGFATDVSGSFFSKEKQLSLTLLFKNLGSELKPFSPGQYQKIPFDIQLALSHRFKYIPVRYHISLHSLYRWEMGDNSLYTPFYQTDVLTGEINYPTRFAHFADNFFRHIIFGLEIEPVKYLALHCSYNHDMHQEMRIPQRKTIAGFAYGFTVNIYSIRVGFSRVHYAAGAVPNYFTFSANIDELTKLYAKNKKKKLQRIE